MIQIFKYRTLLPITEMGKWDLPSYVGIMNCLSDIVISVRPYSEIDSTLHNVLNF